MNQLPLLMRRHGFIEIRGPRSHYYGMHDHEGMSYHFFFRSKMCGRNEILQSDRLRFQLEYRSLFRSLLRSRPIRSGFLFSTAHLRSKNKVLRPTLMGAFEILFCNNFKRVLLLFFIMVDGRKTHSCVEEKMKKGV